MKCYLLDTDIVVFLFRNKKGIAKHLSSLEPGQIYISEVTVAELEYGNYRSGRYEENRKMLDQFLACVHVVPFSEAISLYARERYEEFTFDGLSPVLVNIRKLLF